jgi:hypothetical protein
METTQPAVSGGKRTWQKGNRFELREDHAVIFIPSKGQTLEVLVDVADVPTIQEYTWGINGQYAATQRWENGRGSKKVTTYLHHHLMLPDGTHGHALQVDHINRNKLDNRRANLRLVTPSQNMANIVKHPNACGDGFRGVSYNHEGARGGWKAQIHGLVRNGKRVSPYQGTYDTPEEAARAYDLAALERDGAYAVLNFPEDLDRYLRGEIPPPPRRSRTAPKLKVMPDLAAAS